MIVDYFKNIDTKDKAYWLGFLYADGYVTETQCRLNLSTKDEDVIDKFFKTIEFEPKKYYYEEKIKYKCKSVQAYIGDKEFCSYLHGQGCKSPKAKRIELPDFKNKELDLAFLMGFFDGDGTSKTCSISSGSLKFLEDINKRYGLKKNIKLYVNHWGSCYTLNLGAALKKEAMENYPNSLSRKRFTCPEQKLPFISNAVSNENKIKANKADSPSTRKFEVSKEELEKLIKEKPMTEIGKMFGVSDNAIKKRAKRLGIIVPSMRGYWQKIKALDK